jgi:hypothetical protein
MADDSWPENDSAPADDGWGNGDAGDDGWGESAGSPSAALPDECVLFLLALIRV